MEGHSQRIKGARLPGPCPLIISSSTDELASCPSRVERDSKNIGSAKFCGRISANRRRPAKLLDRNKIISQEPAKATGYSQELHLSFPPAGYNRGEWSVTASITPWECCWWPLPLDG